MRAIVAVGVAILGAEVFTEILLQLQPPEDPFWEWLITLIATVLAALFAIGVFEYQSRQAERDRQDKLLAALAAELQSNLSILRSGHRTPFFDQVSLPGTQKRYVRYADAKLVPLPPVAAESAIQSGVFDAADVYLLTRIVRALHVHNNEVSYLSSSRLSPTPVHPDQIIMVCIAAKELDKRQETIEKWCEELIEFLRVQEGIEVHIPPDTEENNDDSSSESETQPATG